MVWTWRRVLIALFLFVHWIGIAVWALPDWAGLRNPVIGVRAMLPMVNTHAGKPWVNLRRRFVLESYLILTAQRQSWRMFIPRRQNTTYLELGLEDEDGALRRYRFSDLKRGTSILGSRWRFLEASLLTHFYRKSMLPTAVPRLAQHLLGVSTGSVTAVKRGYPVPLLTPDRRGNPLFTSAADYRELLDDAAARFLSIPIGTFALPGESEE